MNSPELLRENAALRHRLSCLGEASLGEASLGITGDLEPGAMLQGVVDGARALTDGQMELSACRAMYVCQRQRSCWPMT